MAAVTRREIYRLALPALGALATEPLVSLVDTAFVARLGTVPLAALGIDVAILGMAFVAFNFLQYGVTPLIGEAHGRGDRAAVARGTRHALVLGVTIGTVMALALSIGAEYFIRAMSAPSEVVPDALTYLRVRAWSGPAVMIVMVGHGVFRGLQDTRTPLVVTIGLNLVNLVLDPVLIFGLGLGVEGAAWASLAAQVVGAVWFVAALRGKGLASWGPIVRAELTALVGVALALVWRTASLVATLTFAARVAASKGTSVVAAHQVAAQVFLFFGLAIDGLAIAGQAMVSMRIGAGDREGVRTASKELLRMGAFAGVALGLLLWMIRWPLAAMFSPSGAVAVGDTVEIAAGFLGWVAVLLVPGALVFVWDGLYLGASRFRFLAVTTFAAAVGAIAYLAALPSVPFGSGTHQVWAGVLLLVVLRGAFQAWDYVRAGSSVLVD